MLSPKVDPSQEYKRRLEDRKKTVEHYRKLDLLIGKNADHDVFPLLLDHLDRTTAPAAGALQNA